MSDQAREIPTGGVDPNVRIPAAVRASAARAEQILRQVKGEDEPGQEGDDKNQDGNSDDTITIVEDEGKPKDPKNAKPAKAKADPKNQPPAPAAPVTPRGNESKVEPGSLEHQLEAMKGRFEKANRENQRMSEEISNLHRVISTMQVNTPATPATPAELRAESLLTPEEIADYGEDFLKVVEKKAREIAAPEINSLKQKIENLEKGVRSSVELTNQSARDRMIASLDTDLPDWRELNRNPDFLQWLSLQDPFSGAIRHDLLKAAYEQNNTPRVKAFFNGFLTEEAAVAPARAPEPNPTPQQRGKVPLETFAAPGRAKSAAAGLNNAPAEKPVITRAQVLKFYSDVAAGKYRGRDQEKNTLEAQIFEAENEGRIR